MSATLEEKIIALNGEILQIAHKLEKRPDSADAKKLRAKMGNLSLKKERYETEYIKKNGQDLFYLGVGVDLDDLNGGAKIVSIPWGDIENHSITLGTTRMGKTKAMLSYIKQNILRGDNVVVVDPKGGVGQEVLNCTLQYASDADRVEDFVYINPAETETSIRFNPLYGMEDDEIASLIGELIYPQTSADNEFYLKYAMSVIKQVLCAITFLSKLGDPDGKKKEIEETYELIKSYYDDATLALSEITGMEDVLSYKHSRSKNSCIRSLVTFKDIAHYMIPENLDALKNTVRNSIIRSDRKDAYRLKKLQDDAIANFDATANIPAEHHGKIAVSLTNWLNVFSTGVFYELFCSVRINPVIQRLYERRVKSSGDKERDPGLIAVIQPLPLRYKKIAEDVNKIVMKMFQTAFGVVSHGGRKLGGRRLFLHLDEGESSLYNGIESILNKFAGLGATANIYTQSFADIDARLGYDVSKIAQDSLNTCFIMKTNDPSSVAKSIELFGTYQETRASFIQGQNHSSASYASTVNNLITTEEIMKLPPACCFFRNRTRRYKLYFPFVSGKINIETYIPESALENSYLRLNQIEKLA